MVRDEGMDDPDAKWEKVGNWRFHRQARSTSTTRETRKAEVKHEAHARASLIRLAG